MDDYSIQLATINNKASYYPHTRYKITDTVLLSIYPEVELFRAKRAATFLSKVGMKFEHPVFDKEKYTPKDPMRRCYDNAAEFSKETGLIYCEGLMLLTDVEGRIIPLSHGWCCDEFGMVVDPTCSNYQHIEQVEYVGVPIRRDYADKWYELTGYNGMLDGHVNGDEVGIYYDHVRDYMQKITHNHSKVA